MKAWERIEPTKILYKGWRTVIQKNFKRSDGSIVTVETNDPEGIEAAGIVGLTKDNQVIIARQFRCGPEEIFDEIPGGAVEANEDPQVAAIREFEEEVGYKVGNVKYLGKAYKHAWLNMTWHYFLATDCVPAPAGQKLDDLEEIEVQLISIEQLIDNARNGRMTDTEAVFFALDDLKAINGGK